MKIYLIWNIFEIYMHEWNEYIIFWQIRHERALGGAQPQILWKWRSRLNLHDLFVQKYAVIHMQRYLALPAIKGLLAAQFSFQQILFQVAQLPIPIELTQIYLSKRYWNTITKYPQLIHVDMQKQSLFTFPPMLGTWFLWNRAASKAIWNLNLSTKRPNLKAYET